MQLKTWLKQQVKGGLLTEVAASITEIQGGTRVLQTACVEAKARKLGAVTRLVPKVKKNIEQFVHSTKVLLAESGRAGGVSVRLGNLKHKNLQGDVVPQVIESEDEEEQDDDDDDDEEGGEGMEAVSYTHLTLTTILLV